MVSVTTNTVLAEERAPSRVIWRGRRYIAEVFDGADEALAALESVQGGLSATGFQSLNWLTVLYEELAPAQRAMPRLVVVSERNSRDVCLILPLVIKKKRSLRVARFADLGVSDYGAPILGPAAPTKRRSIRRMWRAVRGALRDVDLIRLERMPAEISGQKNPLLTRHGITRARHSGNLVVIETTVEDFLRSRGKKYRKEVERCSRLWEKEGLPRFSRASTQQEIARGFSILEEQQSKRHAALDSKYILDETAYSSFYERMVMDGSDLEFSHLFTLEAQGVVVATLFGILHDGTFTLLRIANGGVRWSHLSPGRLVVVETMKYFVERGVKRFDMGMGEYAFKRGFGATEVPLYDLIIARDLKGWPRAAFHRLKGRLRENPRLRLWVRGIKAKFRAKTPD